MSASGRRETADELDLDGHLVGRALEGELGLVLGNPADFEDHGTRLDHRGPELDFALALAHARLRGLAGRRLVREHADPDLALAVERAVDRDPTGFDLAAREPGGVQRLETEVAEGDLVRAARPAADLAAVDFPVLRA